MSYNSEPAALTARQFPYCLSKNDPTFCEWIINNDEPFHEPFFDDSISRLRYLDVNQKKFRMLAHIDMLPQFNTKQSLPPTAIIFHVSRCGSTLVSQVLNLQPSHLVLAEVPFFDELLRLRFKKLNYSPTTTAQLFDSALQLYIQNNATVPGEVFIKADSWHLHFYKELRELYPETPFILLYRNPTEVIRSQQKRRGLQSVPGLLEQEIFGFNGLPAGSYDLDVYMAFVLETYYKKMIDIAAMDSNTVLINYNEGIIAGMHKIASLTNICFDTSYQELALQRAGFHAKQPQERFYEDQAPVNMPANLTAVIKLYEELDSRNIRWSDGE